VTLYDREAGWPHHRHCSDDTVRPLRLRELRQRNRIGRIDGDEDEMFQEDKLKKTLIGDFESEHFETGQAVICLQLEIEDRDGVGPHYCSSRIAIFVEDF